MPIVWIPGFIVELGEQKYCFNDFEKSYIDFHQSDVLDFWLMGKAISLRSYKKKVKVVLLYIGVVDSVRYGIESLLDP